MILVLGLGNVLLSDDGVGVHAATSFEGREDVSVRDGGTLGLSLLPEIETSAGLIAVDAMALGEEPGAVRVFEGDDMDAQLRGRNTSVHQLALADLIEAAALVGCKPERRALVGIQPHSLEWGLAPTPDVQAAIGRAHEAIDDLVSRWRQ